MQQTLFCAGQIINLSTPKVMGILNLTPDSFYDGLKYVEEKQYLNRIETMIEEGTDFIDIGAVSSRPGANSVDEATEKNRLFPAIDSILQHFGNDMLFSLDTSHPTIAKMALDKGIHLINDISGGRNKQMFQLCAEYHCPIIIMHMKGTPSTMQAYPTYDHIVTEISHYFSEQIHIAQQCGVKDIIIDPGFGFGKSLAHNYELLSHLPYFFIHKKIILAGISRKSMICKPLQCTPETALNGTTAAHMTLLMKGAKILRVHDVLQAKEVVTIFNLLK